MDTIQVALTRQRCALGDAYAERHRTTPPKAAVLSCEGMCLRGEIARRAATRLAHELAPDRTVRICHGGLLEVDSGMRDLVEHADQVLMLDGCGLACGTRLLKGAVPDAQPTVIFTDRLIDIDPAVFGVDDLPDSEITRHARTVAEAVLATALGDASNSGSPTTAGCLREPR